jgi:ABC-type lipoprotein release transport system permease subunit
MFWVKTASHFLLRSGRSTYALALMVVTAVVSLIFLSAMAVGVNDAMVRNSTGLYSGQITGFNLPKSLSPEDLRVEGTTRILKRKVIPGMLSNGDLLQSVVMIGMDPGAEKAATALWRKTISGRYPQSGEAALFLGSETANALGVRPDAGWVICFGVAVHALNSRNLSFFSEKKRWIHLPAMQPPILPNGV